MRFEIGHSGLRKNSEAIEYRDRRSCWGSKGIATRPNIPDAGAQPIFTLFISKRVSFFHHLFSHLNNRDESNPRFSSSILLPATKFSGPCSITTTQQNVAIVKKISQRIARTYRTWQVYAPAETTARRPVVVDRTESREHKTIGKKSFQTLIVFARFGDSTLLSSDSCGTRQNPATLFV
jgi:hypothetical protein